MHPTLANFFILNFWINLNYLNDVKSSMKNPEELLKTIDEQSLTVRTDSLDISFGEISSMYEGGELVIRPAYQRLFRWSNTQQSQFIESLLLGLPIPPIFVIETETREYELIDGLQRISTYLRFTGGLKDKNKLKLSNCDIVRELNNLTIDDLSPALKIKVKRSYVKMYIIKKESPARVKYDLFKRLNTGGSLLEAQEIRNSTIRFLDETFVDFIQERSKDENFKNCLDNVQDYLLERQFDDELVLRLFTLKNGELQRYRREGQETLADFLTKYAEDVAGKLVYFDYEEEKLIFEKTFTVLNNALGKSVFSEHEQFLAFHYEAISVATASVVDKINADNTEHCSKIKDNILLLKKDKNFKDSTENKKHKRTSGSSYLRFLDERISIAKEFISKGF
jgi:hypothetical protein